MLKIRQEQRAVLSEHAASDFEDRMVAHVREFFPEAYRDLGEQRTRALIQDGITNAARYDMWSEQDICRFIDLMLVLGRDFDLDPELSWIAEILRQSSTEQSLRLDQIYGTLLAQSEESQDDKTPERRTLTT